MTLLQQVLTVAMAVVFLIVLYALEKYGIISCSGQSAPCWELDALTYWQANAGFAQRAKAH